ncbi:hypothetical protein IRJ41_018563 [Triplophysa rosa]|uniref:Uncharacterized protein n=1 Tax=Triplophysa rosa TaxID=992332 RepID=A0A9W8C219_TRIRA|nr:hypothetical protein IRJ41_018563 [Triplophysa rosa]
MAEPEVQGSEAVKLQEQASPDEENVDLSPQQEANTSQVGEEDALRKSQRTRKLTEKGQALHEDRVNKLQCRFKTNCDKWKVIAKQAKRALNVPSNASLQDHIVRVQNASGEVKQTYHEWRSYDTPDRDTRRRVDTCHAVSVKIILKEEESGKYTAKRLTHWSEAGSVFQSAASHRSKRAGSAITCSSHSSKSSAKKQEAAAELAATEATLKVMQEMEREQRQFENLEVENRKRLAQQEAENAEKQRTLEERRRQIERLETVKKMEAAKACLKVYKQESTSDEEISDLLHSKSKPKEAAPYLCATRGHKPATCNKCYTRR